MLNYKAIEIFTNEDSKYQNKPVADAVTHYIQKLKIAARCIVTRGIGGCYENGELATSRLEVLALNMPIRIYITIPAPEVEDILPELENMLDDGLIVVHDLNVIIHKTRNSFFPRQLLVRDVMTTSPQSISTSTPLNKVLDILLGKIFSGLPVVDEQQRPIGIVTQGDLLRKAGLSLRLKLLFDSEEKHRQDASKQLAHHQVCEVMSSPPIKIAGNKPLAQAVDLMLDKGVKRLPVVNEQGKLIGMVSRLDIFRTVMTEAPNWTAFQEQQIKVGNIKKVSDVLRKDINTVSPTATIKEIIAIIDLNDIQRVAVVDRENKLLGVISDRDLLHYFKSEPSGILNLLAKVKKGLQPLACVGEQCLIQTKAEQVMATEVVTVKEDMLLEKAIALMVAKALKHLPVVDKDNKFLGMIGRDSLLRAGYQRH